MKHLAFLLMLAMSAAGATNLNLRRLDYTNDVQFGASQSRDMLWYKGESVQYNVDIWRDTERVSVPAGASVIWQAWKSNNLSVLYISTTGEVVSADNGQVRATLTPAQANLASGVYNSVLSLWDGTNYVGVAGAGQIRVVWTPAGDSLPYVGATAAAYVPKPTNAWAAGYVLTTSDGGTTTYAAAQSGGGGSVTDTTARAWAQAASNLAALANANQLAASNSLAARLLATSNAIPSLAGYATGTPLYVYAGRHTGDVMASSSAGGHLIASGGSATALTFSAGGGSAVTVYGGLTVGGTIQGNGSGVTGVNAATVGGLAASAFATGAPVYAESDPVWSGVSNAQAQAIATAQATGVAAMARAMLGATNFVPTNAPAGTFYNLGGGVWAVGTNDTAGGGGGGSPTQEVFTILGDPTNENWRLFSDAGSGFGFTNDQSFFAAYNLTHNGSTWNERPNTNRVGAVFAFEPYYEYTNGTGVVRQAELYAGLVHTNISPQDVLGSTAASRLFQMNWIWPGSSGYPNGGREANLMFDSMIMSNGYFWGLLEANETKLYAPLRGWSRSQASEYTNLTLALASVYDSTPWGGGVFTSAVVQFQHQLSNEYARAMFKMYGPDGQLWERVRVDGQGLSVSGRVLVAGGNMNMSGGTISNAAARLTTLEVGTGNANSGSNNVSLLGGATFGAGAYGNVAAGQGVSIGNAVIGSFVGGTNNTQNGSYAYESGRDNFNSGNYAPVNGYQNRNESQLSGILSGDAHTNGSSSIRSVIVGGHRNRIAASSSMATIFGGTNNTVNATGGTVLAGQGGTIGSTSTWSAVYNAGPAPYTNNTPFSFHISAQGGLLVKAIGSTFEVRTNGVYGAIGTGTWSITESGLIVNGVAK